MIRHQKAFDREQRAFSHGCIRLARPRDLAIEILKDEKTGPQKKDITMNRKGREDL
jgi:murein L,D-transpeptidase YcbB/YkuD